MESVYCKHGKYVGGCGADYMCQWCEMDMEPPTIHVQLLRITDDGATIEPIFKPGLFYSLGHVPTFSDLPFAEYGREYALAVDW